MTLSSGGEGCWTAAAGSVAGRAHRLAERDSQDGAARVAGSWGVAVVVTDGCSSGRASEVGARVGAAWLSVLVEQKLGRAGAPPLAGPGAVGAFVAEICDELTARLELLARSLHPAGGIDAARVGEALLFGFLVAVVTRERALVFGVGDGSVLAGFDLRVLDAGPRNEPPYLAYRLLGRTVEPVVHLDVELEGCELDAIVIATDGASPTSLAELGALPRLAENPSLLRKRLLVIAERERLADDATVAILRRRKT